EPFYNGQAFARSLTGEYLVIDESGLTRAAPTRSLQDVEYNLQKLAVVSWRPIAVRLGILAGLAGGENRLAVTASDLEVLESAWIELGLRSKTRGLTQTGRMLAPGGVWEDRFLYWTGPQFDPWTEAEERLKHADLREDFFARHAEDEDASKLIQRVLHSYAAEDWKGISETLRLSPSETVVDLGGGKGALLEEIGQSVSTRTLVDRPEVVDKVQLDGIRVQPLDIFTDEIPTSDVYLLSRILHDWDDASCIHLLKRIPKPSRVIVIDRTANPGKHGLLSLNMLLVSGGRERTNSEWIHLFSNAGWVVEDVSAWSEHSIFSLSPRSDDS
ncbi:MAG: methyltransferase, partial [Candidatus Thermoplasmatota archaeon]|nr:methyltransferase [Candidatus Thermoplasmatota archaeon]